MMLLSSISLSAQSYHKLLGNHHIWEQFQGDASTFCTFQSGQIIVEGNDTTINGVMYKNLSGYHIYSNAAICFTYPFFLNDTIFQSSIMREDTIQKKVFIYDSVSATEFLLYDFSLTDGDSLKNTYVGNFQPSPFIYIVDSVRPINIPGTGTRNCFYFNISGSSGTYYYIESIGASTGINESAFQAIDEVKILQCVRDSLYSPVYGSCFVTVGIASKSNYVTKFNYINFDHSFNLKGATTNKRYTVNIVNGLGQMIYSNQDVVAEQTYSISRNNVGIFYYSVFEDKKILERGKFILY